MFPFLPKIFALVGVGLVVGLLSTACATLSAAEKTDSAQSGWRQSVIVRTAFEEVQRSIGGGSAHLSCEVSEFSDTRPEVVDAIAEAQFEDVLDVVWYGNNSYLMIFLGRGVERFNLAIRMKDDRCRRYEIHPIAE